MTTPAESAGPVPPTGPSVKRRPTMDRVVTRIAQVWVLVGVVVLIAGFVLVEIDAKSGPGIGYMLALVVCPFTLVGLLLLGVGWLLKWGDKRHAAKQARANSPNGV